MNFEEWKKQFVSGNEMNFEEWKASLPQPAEATTAVSPGEPLPQPTEAATTVSPEEFRTGVRVASQPLASVSQTLMAHTDNLVEEYENTPKTSIPPIPEETYYDPIDDNFKSAELRDKNNFFSALRSFPNRKKEIINSRKYGIIEGQQEIAQRRADKRTRAQREKEEFSKWEKLNLSMTKGAGNLLSFAFNLKRLLPGEQETANQMATLAHQVGGSPLLHYKKEGTIDDLIDLGGQTAPFFLATLAATAIRGKVGGFLTAAALEGNNIYETAKQNGMSERWAVASGLVGGVVSGAIEMAGGGGGKYLRKGAVAITAKQATGFKRTAMSTLRKALTTGKAIGIGAVHTSLREGLEEIGQEGTLMAFAKDLPRKNGKVDYSALADRLLQTFIGGAVLGGLLGGPATVRQIRAVSQIDEDLTNDTTKIFSISKPRAQKLVREAIDDGLYNDLSLQEAYAAAPRKIREKITEQNSGADKAQPATVEQRKAIEDSREQLGVSEKEIMQMSTEPLSDISKGAAEGLINKLENIRNVNLTDAELTKIHKAGGMEGVDAAVSFVTEMEKTSPRTVMPTNKDARKEFVSNLREIAKQNKKSRRRIKQGKNVTGRTGELQSARYFFNRLEGALGKPIRNLYSKINTGGVMATQAARDIIKNELKIADTTLFRSTLNKAQNDKVINWLFTGEGFDEMSVKSQKIGLVLQSVLQHQAADLARKLRWKIWYNRSQKATPAIAKLDREIARLTDIVDDPAISKQKSAKTKRKILRLKKRSNRHKKWIAEKQPPDAPDSALREGQQQLYEGKLDEWISSQGWGTRANYYMSDPELEQITQEVEEEIPEFEIEKETKKGRKPKRSERELKTRKKKAKPYKNKAAALAVTSHLEKLMILDATQDDVAKLWSQIDAEKLTSADIRRVQKYLRTAQGLHKETTDVVKGGRFLSRWFWRTYFSNPMSAAWFTVRNLHQNIAYGAAEMPIAEWGSALKDIATRDMSTADWEAFKRFWTKSFQSKIAQRRQLWKQHLTMNEATAASTAGKAATFMDILSQPATFSDTANRSVAVSALFRAAQKRSKQFMDGHISWKKLSRKLRLRKLSESQQLEMAALAENDPAAFASKYAEYKTENIHFRYETALRSAWEQTPGAKLIAGIIVYPRGVFELTYQNSAKPFVEGIKNGDIQQAYQGLVGLAMMALGMAAAGKMVKKITGREAYGKRTFFYTPLSPGIGTVYDMAKQISFLNWQAEKNNWSTWKLASEIAETSTKATERLVPFVDAMINYHEAQNNKKWADAWKMGKKAIGKRTNMRYVHRNSVEYYQKLIFGAEND